MPIKPFGRLEEVGCDASQQPLQWAGAVGAVP
jgi:hypothetical protein